MSAYLEKAEDAIYHIQNKNNIPYHLSILRKMINMEFKCNCSELNIVMNDTKGYFFGAHVFPTEDEVYKIANNVIKVGENIKFEKCSEFVIELDSKLLYEFNATPREILAVVIHEIGHKAFSTNTQVRAKASFTLAVSSLLPAAALVVKVFSPIQFLLSTLILASFESVFATYSGIKTEIEADKLVIVSGYALELNSILLKLSEDSSKSIMLSARKNTSNQEKAITNWTVTNAINFTMRRSAIVSDIEKQLKGETSPHIRKMLESQLKQIKKTKGSFSIKVIKNEEIEEFRNESVRTFFEIHNRGFSYLELDELAIELDRVETHEDKLYLVSRIYKDLRDADDALQAIETGNTKRKYKASDVSAIKDYKKKLGELLKQIKAIKIKTPDYTRTTINIEYPKGYEG